MRTWPLYILDEDLKVVDDDGTLRKILLVATYYLKDNVNGSKGTQRIRARMVDVPLEKKDWELCDWTYGRWTEKSARIIQLLKGREIVALERSKRYL